MKTKPVNKPFYKHYLKKAKECFEAMNHEFSQNRWNSCIINAVHCAISSADALCVFYIQKRHSGERHEDVIRLLATLNLDNLKKKANQLSALLKIKNDAEYNEKLMTESNAKDAVRNAERFFKWVKEILKE